MSESNLMLIIIMILLFHGIGHIMGVIPALGLIDTQQTGKQWLKNWSCQSWLPGDNRLICGVLYLLAFIGFVAAGLSLWGVLFPAHWWPILALVSAVISMAAVIFFWHALILFFPHKVGAIAVNLAIPIYLFSTKQL
jgi:hypothetical protein